MANSTSIRRPGGLVLVDTSVWIDFLRHSGFKIHEEMAGLIRETNRVATCGLVMQELLQGVQTSQPANLLQSRLGRLPFLATRKSTYALAATIFRRLKEKGVEAQTVDATIAAIAIEHRVPLFTLNLRHFAPMRGISKLRLYPVPGRK